MIYGYLKEMLINEITSKSSDTLDRLINSELTDQIKRLYDYHKYNTTNFLDPCYNPDLIPEFEDEIHFLSMQAEIVFGHKSVSKERLKELFIYFNSI